MRKQERKKTQPKDVLFNIICMDVIWFVCIHRHYWYLYITSMISCTSIETRKLNVYEKYFHTYIIYIHTQIYASEIQNTITSCKEWHVEGERGRYDMQLISPTLKRGGGVFMGALRILQHISARWWFQIIFYFRHYLGKWANLTHIFQMGWFNHHLVQVVYQVSELMNRHLARNTSIYHVVYIVFLELFGAPPKKTQACNSHPKNQHFYSNWELPTWCQHSSGWAIYIWLVMTSERFGLRQAMRLLHDIRETLVEFWGCQNPESAGKIINSITGWWFKKKIYVHCYLEKWSNLINMFQMGWFNHQLDSIHVDMKDFSFAQKSALKVVSQECGGPPPWFW